jgi:hypothetical protein
VRTPRGSRLHNAGWIDSRNEAEATPTAHGRADHLQSAGAHEDASERHLARPCRFLDGARLSACCGAALGHLLTGVALCLTIIGIPLGIADIKMAGAALVPFGRQVVRANELNAGLAAASSTVTVPD